MTEPTRIALDALKKELAQAISGADNLAETRANYSRQYAHDALVKNASTNTAQARADEQIAIRWAFWHDGARQEANDSAWVLESIQKLVINLESTLTQDTNAT